MLDKARTRRKEPMLSSETVIASTASGKIRGRKRDGSYYFGAIPYARAGRFEKPRPVEPFSDVFDATALGTVFPNHLHVSNGSWDLHSPNRSSARTASPSRSQPRR
ncbi:hypothetical protein GCM10020255_046510 [Rhodococcus baikonurensis]